MSGPQSAERRRVDLEAGTIQYRVAGPEHGRPVVFVHGFLVDDSVWADVPERLGERGFRALAPTWPLAAHTVAMKPDADLSPRGVAKVVLDFLARLDLHDVVLVGNDTGGAVSQFVIDEDPTRISQLVLTNCDAFDTFPPFPFNLLFRLFRHPGPARLVLQTMRPAAVRNGLLGFGPLVRRPLTAEDTAGWIRPYVTDAGVRHDTTSLLRGWRPEDLVDVATRLHQFEKPVLIAWAPSDRFFKIALGRRLASVFPAARLVEVPNAGTFIPLDQPGRLADEIADFAK
jgi:pimeloyl-ACP methyl ester carboxylesterase